jgi:hypothetical protein
MRVTRQASTGSEKMDGAQRVTISAALLGLICFFLPWVQVSCGGAHDTSSGIDLARTDDHSLWLIPLLMIAIILVGVLRVFTPGNPIFGLLALLSGLTSTYLTNLERSRFANSSGLIAVRLTPWFWLALGSSIALIVSGVFSLLRRPRAP